MKFRLGAAVTLILLSIISGAQAEDLPPLPKGPLLLTSVTSDQLNSDYWINRLTEPDKILFHANNRIKESLRQQSEGKSKDGMEICLIKVNTKNRNVKYAGANRQLWIFNNSKKELEEIKPTKAGIASVTSFDFEYQLNEITLNKGDILYLTSDGYPDQFGGKDGKKYMSKNFKNFLVSNSALPMQQQSVLIRDNINNWMSNYEQVDDLLVIGIKL